MGRHQVLGRTVEGDEDGVRHLDSLDQAAEELFRQAKLEHRSEFKDHEGRHFVLTRERPGHYLVAQTDRSSGWL